MCSLKWSSVLNVSLTRSLSYIISQQPSTSSAVINNKRSFDDALGGSITATGNKQFPSPDDFAQMCRSERKRHREKRRRGQVNAGFDDLKALLAEIDPSTSDKEEINRVDLISRAVAVIKDMNNENENLKKRVRDREVTAAGVGDQVTFAMPFLVPQHDQEIGAMHTPLPAPMMPQHLYYGGTGGVGFPR